MCKTSNIIQKNELIFAMFCLQFALKTLFLYSYVLAAEPVRKPVPSTVHVHRLTTTNERTTTERPIVNPRPSPPPETAKFTSSAARGTTAFISEPSKYFCIFFYTPNS